MKPVLLHDLGNALRASGVDREHAFDVLVPLVPGIDRRQFLGYLSASLHSLILDARAGLLDRRDCPVDARLDVELPRCGNKEADESAPHQIDDGIPLAYARIMGSLKAVGSTIAIAMPSAPELIAVLKALTISPTSDVSDPVH
jgi:hypothetical protein